MITWQDPVALVLAASIVAGSFWLRRFLARRGQAGHCASCGDDTTPRPTVIELGKLRLGRR